MAVIIARCHRMPSSFFFPHTFFKEKKLFSSVGFLEGGEKIRSDGLERSEAVRASDRELAKGKRGSERQNMGNMDAVTLGAAE